MSETVHYTGKIKKIALEGMNPVEQYKALQDMSFNLDDDYLEEFIDSGYFDTEELVSINGEVYEILEKNETDADEEILIAKKEDDSVISFELRYYNGGCSFKEAITDACNKIE